MFDYRLNESERETLKRLRAVNAPLGRWISVRRPTVTFRRDVDMLVLSGLCERRPLPNSDGYGPAHFLDEWRLTIAGIEESERST